MAMVTVPVAAFAGAGGNLSDSPDGAKGFSSTTIVYDSFEKSGGYTLADYLTKWANIYGPGEMAINDTRTFTGGTFNIDAAPFQTAYDFSVYDHIKYLGISTQGFVVPAVGSVEFSIDINAETPGTDPGRIINGTYIQGGAPYAAATREGQQAGATLHMIDFATGQLFDWFVSGHTAFTLIERLPSSVTGGAIYVGRDKMYTQMIDEVAIAPGKHTVSIRYSRDATNDRAEYFLDGKLVSQVRNVGVPLDVQNVKYTGTYPSLGPGELLRKQIGSVAIGHGLFSLLDAFPFQHPESPELAVSIPVSNRLFGQGARASFDNVKVTISERQLQANSAYVVQNDFSSIPQRPAQGALNQGNPPAAPALAVDHLQFSAVTPNPSRGLTAMEFSLKQESRVRLSVYDMQGRSVRVIADGVLAPGTHQLNWDGASATGPVTPGLYFARLEAAGQQYVRRFAIVH